MICWEKSSEISYLSALWVNNSYDLTRFDQKSSTALSSNMYGIYFFHFSPKLD